MKMLIENKLERKYFVQLFARLSVRLLIHDAIILPLTNWIIQLANKKYSVK